MTTPAHRSRRILGLLALAPLGALALGPVAATAATTDAQAQTRVSAKSPNIAKLAGPLAKQNLTWEKCDYGDPGINERFADVPNVQCATVKVPKDWHDPDPEQTWDIRISQAVNQPVASGRYKGTIFVNPGGPGGDGLPWGAAMQERTPDLRPYYNYVGFDPRGVGQSSQVECDYTYTPSSDPLAKQKAIGEQCANDPDVRTITTEQTVYDMDLIRHLLKAPKLDYIGYSYGTWLGAWYSKVFADRAGHMVLDSATDVTEPTLQRTWHLQNVARDRQFSKHLMNWIARHDDVYGLGTDPAQIRENYLRASENLDEFTVLIAWALSGGLSAFPDNSKYPDAAAVISLITEMGGEVGADGASPAAQAEELLVALRGDRAGLTTQARSGVDEGLAVVRRLKALDSPSGTAPMLQSAKAAVEQTGTLSDPFEMIRCGDGQWTQGENFWKNWSKKQAKKAPFSVSLGAGGVPQCAFWQTNTLMPVADADTYPDTVVIQGELDSQTALETGRTSGNQLPNTSAIYIDNEGSHGHFPYGTECLDRPVYNFFLKDRQPVDAKVCQGLPLVTEDTTYETWAKMNKKGKHVAGDSGPFDPARTPQRTAAGLDLVPDDTAVTALVREAVRDTYGERGVKALPASMR